MEAARDEMLDGPLRQHAQVKNREAPQVRGGLEVLSGVKGQVRRGFQPEGAPPGRVEVQGDDFLEPIVHGVRVPSGVVV